MPHSGEFRAECIDCCTELVLSARPSRAAAASLLRAIELLPGNPGRERVLESVRQRLGKPR